jgi:hypothetical protein
MIVAAYEDGQGVTVDYEIWLVGAWGTGKPVDFEVWVSREMNLETWEAKHEKDGVENRAWHTANSTRTHADIWNCMKYRTQQKASEKQKRGLDRLTTLRSKYKVQKLPFQ